MKNNSNIGTTLYTTHNKIQIKSDKPINNSIYLVDIV